MKTARKATIFAAAFAVAATAAGAAFAAQATTSLNVRAWPNGRIVDVLHPGEQVRVVARNGGWCQIEHHGPDGWSACRYLTDSYSQPGWGGNTGGGYGGSYGGGSSSGSVTFSFGSPGFSFSIGSGSQRRIFRPWDHRRDHDCIWRYGQWYCPVN